MRAVGTLLVRAPTGAVEAVMKAKILRYVEGAGRRGRCVEAISRATGGRSIGTTGAAPPRPLLRARWLRSPATGHLEMRWQAVDAGWEDESSGRPAAA
jgi:hypothetical protein